MKVEFATRAILLLGIIVIAGCSYNGYGSIGGISTYATQQVGGSYSLLSQNCYSDLLDIVNDDSPFLAEQIVGYGKGWKEIQYKDDGNNWGSLGCGYLQINPAVYSTFFTNASAISSDFIWYTGHGDVGQVALYNYILSQHLANPEGDATSFNELDPALPYATFANGPGLKWIFLHASMAVQDYGNSAHWRLAFNDHQNGINGVYGFEGEPASSIFGCPPDCPGQNLVTTFLNAAVTSPFCTAWIRI